MFTEDLVVRQRAMESTGVPSGWRLGVPDAADQAWRLTNGIEDRARDAPMYGLGELADAAGVAPDTDIAMAYGPVADELARRLRIDAAAPPGGTRRSPTRYATCSPGTTCGGTIGCRWPAGKPRGPRSPPAPRAGAAAWRCRATAAPRPRCAACTRPAASTPTRSSRR